MRLLILFSGCVALASAAGTPGTGVTFHKDVEPILQKNCQTCHRPGEAAPMSLLSYASARPWAKAMKTAVLSKKMPPWFADPHYGTFSNDRSLAQKDIDTLVAWVDAGAPEGDAKDAPQPVNFVEGWRIGKPDLVISMPTAFEVPAKGTIDYQYVVIPTGFTEDKYIQLAEARPGDRAAVHHIIAFVREPGSKWLKDAKPGVAFVPKDGGDGFADDFLAGYAPGTVPDIMKPGQAKMIKAGSDIVFQLHYTANGKPSTDVSKLGIVFSKEPPKERLLTLSVGTAKFAIPPGDSNYQVDAKLQLQNESMLMSFLPHMHFRGKDFEYRLVYPSGEKETALLVPHYDFNWQLSYDLAQPKLLPKGTVIEATAHYDNSVNNRYNPDATKEVHYGEQTWEEMMFGFFDVAVPVNVTARDLLVPKNAKASANTGF